MRPGGRCAPPGPCILAANSPNPLHACGPHAVIFLSFVGGANDGGPAAGPHAVGSRRDLAATPPNPFPFRFLPVSTEGPPDSYGGFPGGSRQPPADQSPSPPPGRPPSFSRRFPGAHTTPTPRGDMRQGYAPGGYHSWRSPAGPCGPPDDDRPDLRMYTSRPLPDPRGVMT